MADAQDLHQIEYRHHQERDLSPVASSMPSRESQSAWDSVIRAWVRHPHSETLSESACYQELSNGRAALAWRYWDPRAVVRADGSHGRPLVSRVLVGQASVLTPEVALATCWAGLSEDWIGPLPGEVPEGGQLPMVSGNGLATLARRLTPELDRASAAQDGLQAVVAAALSEPSVPLAISGQDALICKPLRESVQCPLLWGLRRIAGPLLGPVGRGWSFSTFELALGEMDPKSLPSIVFREAQDGVKAAPLRYRREVKVRPFAAGALEAGTSYADKVELAGWLVTEYQQRGGDELEQLIAEAGGSDRPFQMRLDRVDKALRRTYKPAETPAWKRYAEQRRRPPAGEVPAAEAPPPEALAPQAPVPPLAPQAEPEDAWPAQSPGGGAFVEAVPAEVAAADREPECSSSRAEALADSVPAPDADPGEIAGQQPAAAETAAAYAQPGSDWPAAPLPHEGDQARRSFYQPPPRTDLAPSREGLPPPLPPSPRGRPHADRLSPQPAGSPPPAGGWNAPPAEQARASALLRELELIEDQEQFWSTLDRIHQIHEAGGRNDPGDRARSWDIISNSDWYENISRRNNFRSWDLPRIFYGVVIPELAEQPPAEAIARWALEAPVPMIEALLTAAKNTDPQLWHIAMVILEPALAYRWTIDKFIHEQWDARRAVRASVEFGRGDGKGGILNRLRKH